MVFARKFLMLQPCKNHANPFGVRVIIVIRIQLRFVAILYMAYMAHLFLILAVVWVGVFPHGGGRYAVASEA